MTTTFNIFYESFEIMLDITDHFLVMVRDEGERRGSYSRDVKFCYHNIVAQIGLR